MKTEQTYKSFNRDKSLEELLYTITKHIIRLKDLESELRFYTILIDKPIFKPRVLNLFEMLTKFKNELLFLDKIRSKLLRKMNKQMDQITNKIACQDIVCDSFFVGKYDEIELETFNFYHKISNFKKGMFQYIQSVINN